MVKMLALDPTKCRGCQSCVIACSSRHGVGDINISRIKVKSFLKETFFIPLACFQCETPYCAQVCPVTALVKNPETGVVELNKEKCIGCKLCVTACPFGNMSFVNNKASKCDQCEGDPTCVKACAYDALKFVEVEEMFDSRMAQLSEKILKSQKDFLQPLEIPNYKDKKYDGLGSSNK